MISKIFLTFAIMFTSITGFAKSHEFFYIIRMHVPSQDKFFLYKQANLIATLVDEESNCELKSKVVIRHNFDHHPGGGKSHYLKFVTACLADKAILIDIMDKYDEWTLVTELDYDPFPAVSGGNN